MRWSLTSLLVREFSSLCPDLTMTSDIDRELIDIQNDLLLEVKESIYTYLVVALSSKITRPFLLTLIIPSPIIYSYGPFFQLAVSQYSGFPALQGR